MTQARRYNFKLTNTFRSQATITEEDSGTPLFHLDLGWIVNDRREKASHSVVLRAASSDNGREGRVLGVADLSFSTLRVPIHIALGDPYNDPKDLNNDPHVVVWEGLRCLNVIMTTPFELNIHLGGSRGRRTFDWKRTHNRPSGNILSRKLDWLSFKMVERETQTVVARFFHNLLPGWNRGYFLLEEYDGGKDWTTLVILSGTAMLEYARKLSGLSW